MSAVRSRRGCWTCRLRKKKCDETHPHCSTCELLSITCYGYGPKPDWIGGEKERAVTDGFKQIVKRTWRRKDTIQFPKDRDTVIQIAPKTSVAQLDVNTASSSHNSSTEDGCNTTISSADSLSAENREPLLYGSMFPKSAEDSVLLMHFLDNVFPLQYPMYKSGILDEGRGWLLSLLLRTKPLYHAALALSAYHRRTIMLANSRATAQAAALVEQEKHLELCLTDFRNTLKPINRFVKLCPSGGLGIIAAVVQLVYFELFAGEANAWQIHLRAGTHMFYRVHKENLYHHCLSERSKELLGADASLSEESPSVAEEVAVFRCYGGSMIWLDIISSITTGTAPRLLPFHYFTIGPLRFQTRLEDYMGCKNWVVLQIGRTAGLYEQKTLSLQEERFDCAKFDQAIVDIRLQIQSGLEKLSLEEYHVSKLEFATISDAKLDPVTLITHSFAYMASVYLHLITHGFCNLEELDTTISGAMWMLHTQIPTHLQSGIVAPLFVIGSVARPGDEQFFRNAFSSAPLLDPLLEHRGRILPILEEIWSRRHSIPGFSWGDSLELTQNLLLL